MPQSVLGNNIAKAAGNCRDRKARPKHIRKCIYLWCSFGIRKPFSLLCQANPIIIILFGPKRKQKPPLFPKKYCTLFLMIRQIERGDRISSGTYFRPSKVWTDILTIYHWQIDCSVHIGDVVGISVGGVLLVICLQCS